MASASATYDYEVPIARNRTKTITKCRYRLNSFKDDERGIIFGLTGTGKSYLLDKIMRNQARRKLVVLLDTKDEYDYPILTVDKILNPKTKGLYRIFQIDFNGVMINNLTTVCIFLMSNLFKRGNCLLVVEEVADVIPKKSGTLYDIDESIGKYIQQGRRFNCAFIGTSQRPADTHTSLTSQSNHIISFLMSLEHDTKYLKQWFPELIYKRFHKSKNDKISHEFVRFYVNEQKTYHHFKFYTKKSE